MAKPVLLLAGSQIVDLDGFYDAISRILEPGIFWGHNLDAFNDVLRGGFGTPGGGFVLRWEDSARSRVALGYPETVRHLEARLKRCHPTNVPLVEAQLGDARRGVGPTLFETLVAIIEAHGAGGDEAEDGVDLVLA